MPTETSVGIFMTSRFLRQIRSTIGEFDGLSLEGPIIDPKSQKSMLHLIESFFSKKADFNAGQENCRIFVLVGRSIVRWSPHFWSFLTKAFRKLIAMALDKFFVPYLPSINFAARLLI
jgi:hypothetical protein